MNPNDQQNNQSGFKTEQGLTFGFLHQSQFPNGIIRPLMLSATLTLGDGDLYVSTVNNTFVRVPLGLPGQVAISQGGTLAFNYPIPRLATDPVAPIEGVAWYNTTTHVFKYFNGTAVKTITAT